MANTVKRCQDEEHFVDGYVPQSMNVKYSSLRKSIIWIGMGLVLIPLAAWGTFIFGLATTVFADEITTSYSDGFLTKDAADYTDYTSDWNSDDSMFMRANPVVALITVIAGVACISIGRRDYKAYRKESGTHH